VNSDPAFRRLLWATLIALPIGAALVVICYFFVDQPFAFLAYANKKDWAPYIPYLKWLTFVPTTLEKWVPVILVVLMVRRVWGPLRRCQLTLLVACVSLGLGEMFKGSLAYVCGRPWPETWINNNPSLIGTGTYAFNPFHGGQGWASFPSGHTARMLAAIAPVWVAYPRWRWVCVAAAVPVPVGLLGMDYHFVGDVVGGGFVGAIVGGWAAFFCGLNRRPEQGSVPADRDS
jgi:membrane-associated phospholipid phosphatase